MDGQQTRVGSRSRFGCTSCRHKHRKCDEKRPTCGPCSSRNIQCDYQVTLKWASNGSLDSYNPSSRRKRKTSSRKDQEPDVAPPGQKTSSPKTAPARTRHDSIDCSLPVNAVESSAFSPLQSLPSVSTIFVPPELTPSPTDLAGHYLQSSNSHEDHLNQQQENDGGDTGLHGGDDPALESDEDGAFGGSDASHDMSDVLESHAGSQPVDIAGSEASSAPWVIDSALSNLLFQIFQNTGEEIAFTYFFKRVCRVIPAWDSDRNPWRTLALVALSYPVLLHGIIFVSTSHMYNYGRNNEAILSARQSRALSSLQMCLDAIQRQKSQSQDGEGESGPLMMNNSGVFYILSPRQIALAAIMMQTSSVLMTGIGNVETHMKCAWHFVQDLNYTHQLPVSIFSRILVYRFAMVDVVLAYLRFRRPLAPLDFFMYCPRGDAFDHVEPAFHEMQGCPHRVLCFLAEIAVLSSDLMTQESQQSQILARAYNLENEMRTWGANYQSAISSEGAYASPGSDLTAAAPSRHHQEQPQQQPYHRRDLETLCETFYWTAHLLLMRRVFGDPTRSPRVQLVRRHLFRLMDTLEPGCGPDASLPFPFYIAAREAVVAEERDWVRQRHASMMDCYRDRSREFIMKSTEDIWTETARPDVSASDGVPFWKTHHEKFIRDTDREASYFMF